MRKERRLLIADDNGRLWRWLYEKLKGKYLINIVPRAQAVIHGQVQKYDLIILDDPKPNPKNHDLVGDISKIREKRPEQKIAVFPGPTLSFEAGRTLKVQVMTVEEIYPSSIENLLGKQFG